MDVRKRIKQLMQKNQRTVDGHFFTVPSPERYPFQWLWDSCFHAYIYSALGEPAKARAELESLLSQQRPSGRIPHIIFWKEPKKFLPNWGREQRGHDINQLFERSGVSSITQPPLVARAVYDLYLKDHDLDLLKKNYDALEKYFSYLYQERKATTTELLCIVNPDESGEDNARRFDGPLGLTAEQSDDDHLSARLSLMKRLAACDFDTSVCMQKHFAVIDLSFNCIYADSLKAMAQIAHQINRAPESSTYSKRRADLLKDMREHLSADGTHFVSRDLIGERTLPATDWTRFMPLYAGMVSKKEAEKLVAELFTKDTYLSPHGIRTLSKADPAYDPTTGFWRGPIWHAPHFFIYKGLTRYGFKEEAKLLREYTKQLITTSDFFEYYDAENGSGLGAKNFTWGGLFLAMD